MGSKFANQTEAPFPLWLADFFVRSFCKPDGIVLDPMCGSGTSAVAALNAGRRAAIGDIRQSQITLSLDRLQDEAAVVIRSSA
jgi:site-specific DNA-methyltransferase (adenine-specific)